MGNVIPGCVMIAIWGWQLARRLLARVMDWGAARHAQPGAHRQVRPVDPGEWRDYWFSALGIITGIVYLVQPHGPVRWAVIGVQIVMLIVLFPFWNPGAWLKRRRESAADGQARA